jgi:hypothetical protein
MQAKNNWSSTFKELKEKKRSSNLGSTPSENIFEKWKQEKDFFTHIGWKNPSPA